MRVPRTLALAGTLLAIYGGGCSHIRGRGLSFSGVQNESPPLSSAAPGRNVYTPPRPVHRSVREHASRSEKRRALCTPATWKRSASADELWIISRESGGDPRAWNPVAAPTGHAFGLGQLTDAIRARIAAQLRVGQLSADPCIQLRMMRAYIAERYGSAAAAVAFWQTHGWY